MVAALEDAEAPRQGATSSAGRSEYTLKRAGRVRLRGQRQRAPRHRPARRGCPSCRRASWSCCRAADDARQPTARCGCRTSTSAPLPFGLEPQRARVGGACLARALRPARALSRSCAGARAGRPRCARCFSGPLRVINVGLSSFARDLAANGAAVAQVDWAPPKAEMLAALQVLSAKDSTIQKANARGVRAHALGRAGAGGRVPRRQGDAGARSRARDAARGAADRVGAHVRADAGRACGAIGFEGWAPTSPRRAAASRRRDVRAQSPLRRGRPDDRHHHALDAGPGRARTALRQPRLLPASTKDWAG